MPPMTLSAALISLALFPTICPAQDKVVYDETQVPRYTLPDPLISKGGKPVTSAEQWRNHRRPELLQMFRDEMYGSVPVAEIACRYRIIEQADDALDGLAIRKQVSVFFSEKDDGPRMDILLYLPRDAKGPVPTFLGLNFFGNHSISHDPNVPISTRWMRNDKRASTKDHRASDASRGKFASRWPLEQILSRGYGIATIYCGDIDPDFDDGFQNGIHPLFYRDGQNSPTSLEWGTIAAWAWGLSRALDYFEQDKHIDAKRVTVLGHSRLGKTALWAGAEDERFALVISNNSGCGGAALSRRRFGERIQIINRSFPHWFCDNFLKYDDRENQLPFDQHSLIALIAPRPVLVCSAEKDLWADPRGEFLAAKNADSVYQLLGQFGMKARDFPDTNQLTGSSIGYHIRPGEHNVKPADWKVYCDFADRFLKPAPATTQSD